MRLPTPVLVLFAWHIAPSTIRCALAQQCVLGSFTFEFEGECNYDTVLEEYTRQIFEATGSGAESCGGKTAKEDLDLKLAGTSITEVCHSAHTSATITPFYDAVRRGKDMSFEQHFFNGRTDLQEEVETVYESADGSATSILKEDAALVNDFYRADGTFGRVQWPNMLTNFDDSTCSTNAAMCCWPKDRQANDNNGNCNKPYDVNCVDKDPADNTNLCYVDMKRGQMSNEFGSDGGFISFPGDNDDGEGDIHCHGLAWANDEDDPITRYRGNNLFYVAMYDHMYVRGYVKNIPGAPMCACLEQMPVVSRSDCTQVDLVESYRIIYDGSSFSAKVLTSEIDFNSCQGRNNDNNDLWAYSARLFDEGKMTKEQFSKIGKILTDTNCNEATKYFYQQQGLTRGHQHDVATWTKVAGRDSLKEGEPFGMEAFRSSFFVDSSSAPTDPTANPLDSTPVMMRVCITCQETHQYIFYRRLTPVDNPDFDILGNLLYSKNDGGGENVWGEDFTLHSTYEDALAGDNPWQCPGGAYNYGAGFPGNCSPDGTSVSGQGSIFPSSGSRSDVAFYVNKPEAAGVQVFSSVSSSSLSDPSDVDIGDVGIPGTTREDDGTYYITASGNDIWGTSDQFHYLSEAMTGDVQAEVFVAGISNIRNAWAKAGIMLRTDNEPDSAYAFALLSGSEGIDLQIRASKGDYSSDIGDAYKESPAQTEAWLKIVKKQEVIEMYRSEDGITWTVHASVKVFFPNDSFRIGLAIVSHHNGQLSEATFENYDVSPYAFPSASPSISLSPTVWDPLVEIGDHYRSGEYTEGADMIYVKGSGEGIWGTNDDFFFYNVQKSNSASMEVVILLNKFENWNRLSKGGIMIRDSNDPGSPHALIAVTGRTQGVLFQSRETMGGSTTLHAFEDIENYNVWLKLTKTDSTIAGSYRLDSESEWSSLGSASLQLNPDTVQAGMAVTAGSDHQYALVTMEVLDFEIIGG